MSILLKNTGNTDIFLIKKYVTFQDGNSDINMYSF